MANRTLFGKTTSTEGAHATYRVDNSSNGMYFEWRVLKTYQSKDNEDKNPYARWYCAVKSPYTHDKWEYGDTYIKDIMSVGAKLIKSSGKWREQYNDDLMYDVAGILCALGIDKLWKPRENRNVFRIGVGSDFFRIGFSYRIH